MVVCKFFQQGYCRYGQSCRFEHIYGSKYSYHAAQVQQNQHQNHQNQNTTSGVTDEQLVHQVQTHIQAVLKGGQWILSCYAPFKEKPQFPGISDLSPEEARLFIYEAKANNNLEQAISFMNKLFQEGKQKYEALLQPTPNIVKTLRSLYNGEVPSSPFSTGQSSGFGSTSAASIFREAAHAPSVFGPNSNSAQSIFAQANKIETNTAAKSIFAQATQNLFGSNQQSNQNVFSNQQQHQQSIFATSPPASQQQTNVFGAPQQNTFFGSGNALSSPQSVFAQQSNANDMNIFSKEDELSEFDLEAFKSDKFTLGFIPEIPPPQSLC